MTTQYPLTWPALIPRQKTREPGRFKTTLAQALANVENSLALFGKDSGKAVSNFVISTNYTLTERRPADPGVAVWFTWDGIQVAIPIDRYTTIEANLQAVHQIVEARRVELRHGTLALVRATFTGLLALAPPSGRSWREVLGMSLQGQVTRNDITMQYRHRSKGAATEVEQKELNVARDQAMKETPL
ncbi:J domain-containing protein [Mesorhizobium sp. M0317]|uniref:J domain-containing protein n=1 Tax=Mesorhizobium sp. M0317 TaxID=2956935 RepID=UPI00333AABD7